MGQLTMIPIGGSSEIKQLCGLGWGNKILFLIRFKAAPWDDINFRFKFCIEVVHPTDHDFIFFRVFRFLQIFFYSHVYESDCNPKKTFCIPKHLLKDVWMLLHHWDTCWCRRPRHSVLRGNPPDQPVPTEIKGGSYWCNYVVTLIMPSERSVFTFYIVVCFKQTCLHDSIRLGNRACLVFSSALTLFFFTFLYFISDP